MNPEVDAYFTDGCGRCSLYATPECRVHTWAEALQWFRRIALDCGLQEELKWGVPCYTWQKKNIALIGAFKEYCSFSFFKGVLLQDSAGLLSQPGENSQSVRMFRVMDFEKSKRHEAALRAYIFEAIEVEKAGLKVALKKTSDYGLPEELEAAFERHPALKTAFEALTPGRQRAYLLHFSQAKQSATRTARIEKCTPAILAGKGWNER